MPGRSKATERTGVVGATPGPSLRASITGLDDEEARAHYQQRLSTCFGALGGMLLAFQALIVAAVLLLASPRLLLEPAPLATMARIPVLLAGAQLCRGRLRGVTALAAVEVGVTVGAMALSAVPVALDRRDMRADMSAIALLLLLLSLRAGLLPATPRWARLVSSLAAAPLVVGAALYFARELRESPPMAWTVLGSTILWSVAAIVMTGVVSRTIHGLMEQVETARKLGQYTLEDRIGEGGMGVVYKARHALLRRPAAIKLLVSERADQADLARFEREVQLTSQLTHPNTVSIFDYGRTAAQSFYYVMEYLDGFDLDRLVKENGPLPPARVIHILAQVSGALHEAHLMGLVHRDIKPANIILTERADEPDVAKVVDFGLVRAQSRDGDPTVVTGVNAIIGTPAYLAPEAILAADSADARSDLYALGAVGYFLLTGEPVFRAPTVVEICRKHLLEPPVPPSQRGQHPVPADLEAVILACLAKEPGGRPASAEALRGELLRCADAANLDRAAAKRWWQERRGLTHHRPVVPASPTLTLPIELRARAESASEP